jgi:hypothetical protein
LVPSLPPIDFQVEDSVMEQEAIMVTIEELRC